MDDPARLGAVYEGLGMAIVWTLAKGPLGGVEEGRDRAKMTVDYDRQMAAVVPAHVFARRCQHENPAVVPERCGLFGFDIDGPEAREHLEALVARHGLALPDTPRSTSGRPGHEHWFYAAPAGYDRRDLRRWFGHVVEVTATGRLAGYDAVPSLTLPPAVHSNGTTCEWIEGAAPWDLPFAELPAPLWHLLRRSAQADMLDWYRSAVAANMVR